MPRYEQLPDEEIEMRSVLMRVYHSHYLGEAAYPARFVNGHAPELATKGWIERCGDGWCITVAGILAWAQMNETMLKHRWAIQAAQFNELRAVLDIHQQAVGICKTEGCHQPRKQAASGVMYVYCEHHQHERWAADKRRRYHSKSSQKSLGS